ncbi:hypothetical protein AWC38_SpisGene9625 [Stylophora pistillata]|uniref:Uncharacterized protein n=1 Tax=Stylophora pistillata TaxID=50429 RepID=A0A2B4S8M7_STYPI|nr:hypothetical protein AWC38_SpisGene9625 [Stylophora pistillata]
MASLVDLCYASDDDESQILDFHDQTTQHPPTSTSTSNLSPVSHEAQATQQKSPQPDCLGQLDSPHHLTPTPTRKKLTYALSPRDIPPDVDVFLDAVSNYFTRAVNLERQSAAVAQSTFLKARERMMCYLGFLKRYLGMDLAPDVFLRLSLMEQYFNFLRDAQMIRQLRAQATISQKQGDKERPSSREELEALNRWLFCLVVQSFRHEIVAAVSLQGERFQLRWEVNMETRESCILVPLSLYVLIPPSRGFEMCTLRIVTEPDSLEARLWKEQNLLVMREDSIVLYFNDYRTKSPCGQYELAVQMR